MATKRTTKKTAKTEDKALPVWLTIVAETAAAKAEQLQAQAGAGK